MITRRRSTDLPYDVRVAAGLGFRLADGAFAAGESGSGARAKDGARDD